MIEIVHRISVGTNEEPDNSIRVIAQIDLPLEEGDKDSLYRQISLEIEKVSNVERCGYSQELSDGSHLFVATQKHEDFWYGKQENEVYFNVDIKTCLFSKGKYFQLTEVQNV